MLGWTGAQRKSGHRLGRGWAASRGEAGKCGKKGRPGDMERRQELGLHAMGSEG